MPRGKRGALLRHRAALRLVCPNAAGAGLAGRPRAEFTVRPGGPPLERIGAHRSDLTAAASPCPTRLIRRFDYSRDGVRRSLEASLDRLGLDHVDIVYVTTPTTHGRRAPTRRCPRSRSCATRVHRRDRCRHERHRAALRIVAEADVDAVMVAGRWTARRPLGAALARRVCRPGVSVVAAARSTGLLASLGRRRRVLRLCPAPADVLKYARRLARACERHGTVLPHAAMRSRSATRPWPASSPAFVPPPRRSPRPLGHDRHVR